jgi:hypothetical protein
MVSKTFALKLQDSEYDLLQKILADQEFSDVTLVSEDGLNIKAHRVVLSACSEFFPLLFKSNPSPKMIIYMDNHSMNHSILESLVRFIYTGQVNIEKDKLKKFLELGEKFKTNGLDDDDERCARNSVEEQNKIDTQETVQMKSEFTLNQFMTPLLIHVINVIEDLHKRVPYTLTKERYMKV